MSADMDRRQDWLKSEAAKVASEIRDTTLDLCIRCIGSLKTDGQGLSLDPATIEACVYILQSLRGALPSSPKAGPDHG